jgi:hypothetical protein
MKNGETPYQPYLKYITVSPTSEPVTGGPNGSTDHPEAVKSTPCQPKGAARDAKQPEPPQGDRSATPPSGDVVAENPSASRTPPAPTASPRSSSCRPRTGKTGRPRTGSPSALDPPEREQPTALKFPVPRNRDRPPLSPWPGVIIVDKGIVVKQVTRHGKPAFYTKEVTKIAPSHREILSRIKQKGRLDRWDPKEDLPCKGIDEEGGGEDFEVIFDCDDILGPNWKGRDLGPDVESEGPAIQDPLEAAREAEAARKVEAARKLEAATKRVERFNDFGRFVTGMSMPWIEEEAWIDGKPTKWRVPAIFYREF